jgi:6-phosphogluconolactonase
MGSGKLSHVSTSPYTVNPSYLSLHPGGWLYAVNEMGSDKESAGQISAFRMKQGGRELEFINSVSSGGNYPCHITIDHSGKLVMAANYGNGTVSVFSVLPDGSLGEPSVIDQHKGRGPTPRQEGPHAHMILPSPDNRFAYSCDLGTDKIYQYKLEPEQGIFISTGNDYTASPGAGPRHMAFHPRISLAYSVNELNGTIECMKVDTLTGVLTRLQLVSTVEEGRGNEASCADIQIDPMGSYLYASNRGTLNNIAMYSIDPVTGLLTLLGHHPVNGKTPRSFVIDPTGTFLLVANQDSDNIVVFRIDPVTGRLVDTGIQAVVPTPVCLKFLP